MKKFIIFLLIALGTVQITYAQISLDVYRKDLPTILISPNVSLHFISPEPIQYVDISTHSLTGDLPMKNVLRLKIIPDSLSNLSSSGQNIGIVTIVGESFIAQYNLCYSSGMQIETLPVLVNILPEHTRSLDVPGISLTSKQMESFALGILATPTGKTIRSSTDYGLNGTLNHVYTAGDYIFLDISYYNKTNLSYEIDEQRFKIEDKKIVKATNVQSVEIKPVWQLYPTTSFKKHYRNIYVLKKTTFPGNKVLNIELTEKQISGRTLTLKIKYGDLLKADSL